MMSISATVPVQEENKQVTFSELPDELLVLIFLHLSAEDLACRLSQVCVRWQSVVKCPKLWENAVLLYEESRPHEFQKIIQFAPCLSKVEINMFKQISDTSLQSIISGCGQVRCLSFYPSISVSVYLKLGILDKYHKSLEKLNFYLDDSYLISSETSEALVRILNRMDKLEELVIRGSICYDLLKQKLFQFGLENLKMLDISGLAISSQTSEAQNFSVWQNFIFNNLENRTGSLHKLALPPGVFNFSTIRIIEEKFVLSSIEDLTVCEMCLWAVKNLKSIKKLHIKGMTPKHLNQLRLDCHASSLSYYLLFDWIDVTPQFAGIKELVLDNIFDDERGLVVHLLNACQNLQSLTIFSTCHSPAQLAWIMSKLPLLKRLNLHHMQCLKPGHLELIVSLLPNLSHLNLRCNSLTDGILQFYRDNVQARMPNLQLECDWGYWSRSGGHPWHCENNSPKLPSPHITIKSKIPSPYYLSPQEKQRIRSMLEEITDYESDD